jgi:hypothetical protein
MLDVEIESLLDEAGYRFNPASGHYETAVAAADGGAAEATEVGGADGLWTAEDIADQLEIPLEDLERWQTEQQGVGE